MATGWAVPDGATLALMTEFYRRWRHGAGESPDAAVAAAQGWVRDSTNEEKLARWCQASDGTDALSAAALDVLEDVYLMREPGALDDAGMDVWHRRRQYEHRWRERPLRNERHCRPPAAGPGRSVMADAGHRPTCVN